MPGMQQVAQTTAISIGNFDGAHVGHAALVSAARMAVGGAGRVVVLAFDPNPLAVLRPESTPPRLSAFVQRVRCLKRLGADEIVPLKPTREFLQQSPEQFIEDCARRWHPSVIVEGADFRFGHHRAGSIETLRQLESRHAYRTIVVDPVEVVLTDQSMVRASSSLARWLVARGRVRDAARVLGRPYEIEAMIAPGDRRGREIGFPTANLQPDADVLLPGDGIYAGIAERDDGERWIAAISVGVKPTFGQHPRVCEAHLLDYHGAMDEYGWSIRLHFTHWLRDQLTFPNTAALIEQLHRDVARTREIVNEARPQPVSSA
jgi:riboflavin kinase/FMN adenylyltransferase